MKIAESIIFKKSELAFYNIAAIGKKESFNAICIYCKMAVVYYCEISVLAYSNIITGSLLLIDELGIKIKCIGVVKC